MLGAIIGDLAVWTYEHDRVCFWQHLVSNEAKVSEFGLSVIATTAMLRQYIKWPTERAARFTRHFFRNFYTDVTELSPVALEWSTCLDVIYQTTSFGICLMRMATCSFFDEPYNDLLFEKRSDDEDRYAILFLCKMTSALREGKTKDEAFADIKSIYKNCGLAKEELSDFSVLTYLFKAWDAFYRAFDFTSAIHNAMCMEGDKRLLGALTGAIASAMYGCRYRLIKKKYQKTSSTPYEYIKWPEALKKHYIKEMQLLEKKAVIDRNFFPKNMALTNVERHMWVSMENNLADMAISEETKESLLYAYFPDWDRRYQLYLENGWIYVCRSGFVSARFQLQKLPDKTYRIWHTQRAADDTHNAEIAMREAITSLWNDIDEKKKLKLWT